MDLNPVRNPKTIFAPIILISFVFLFNFKKVYDPEVFYHLKMGEIVASTWSYVKTEQISFYKFGIRTVHYDWLGDLVLYMIYKISSYPGLGIFKNLIWVLIFYLFFKSASRLSEYRSLFVMLLLLTAFSLRFFVVETPLLFTFFFFSLTVVFLLDIKRRWFYALPLIFLIWANTHPGFIFGVMYFFLFLIGLLLEKRTANFFVLLAIFVLSALATILTPFKTGLFKKLILSRVLPDFIMPDTINILELFKHFHAFVLFIFISLLVIYNIKMVQQRYLVPFLAMVWLPFNYASTVSILLLCSMPLVVQVINAITDRNRVVLERMGSISLIRILFKSIPLLFSLIVLSYYYYIDIAGVYGIGRLDRYYPAGAINFIRTHQLYGRGFNSIELGGALALESKNDFYPFIYSGNYLLSDIYNNYYRKFIKEPESIINSIKEFNLTGFILSAGSETDYRKHVDLLMSKDFIPVYWDDVAVLLVNRYFVDNNFMKEFKLSFNPYLIIDYLNSIELKGEKIREDIFYELKKSVDRASHSSRVHLAMGIAYMNYDKFHEAEVELKKSLEIQPASMLTSMKLAELYRRINRPEEAEYYQRRVQHLRWISEMLK